MTYFKHAWKENHYMENKRMQVVFWHWQIRTVKQCQLDFYKDFLAMQKHLIKHNICGMKLKRRKENPRDERMNKEKIR